MLADKTLTCTDCHAEFVFTVGEQQFFATKNFTNEPKRCPGCRQKKREQPHVRTDRRRRAS